MTAEELRTEIARRDLEIERLMQECAELEQRVSRLTGVSVEELDGILKDPEFRASVLDQVGAKLYTTATRYAAARAEAEAAARAAEKEAGK